MFWESFEMEFTFWSYIVQNPTQMLMWLVYGIGIVLSLRHGNANPKKYTLILIAFLIFLLESIGSALMFVLTLNFDSLAQGGQYHQAYICITTPFLIAAWTILLVTLFPQTFSASESA